MLIGAGHTFEAIKQYTPAQIALFAGIENRRTANQRVNDARIAAIGAQVGFSGKLDALRSLESQARRIDVNAGASKLAREVRKRMNVVLDQMKRDAREKAKND